MDIAEIYQEVSKYVEELNVEDDGEHLWSNYQEVSGILIRLSQIRMEIAYLEVLGRASAEAKKFRTLVLDPTIERFDKVAAFESRKITARQVENTLER